MKHIVLPVLDNSGTSRATSEVLEVEDAAGSWLKLLHSPALIGGIASGDTIELDPQSLQGFRLMSRGGNVSVIMVFPSAVAKATGEKAFERTVLSLGGTYDGGPEHIAVASVPVSAGFPAMDVAFNQYIEVNPESTWWYGNVYSSLGEPLNWWAPSV